ncbi:MAG: hypothetical protein HOQ36_11240 [Nocardia sp.]|nr:hypothetical protein [Nocardia sp.]NUS92972.1 hypothetical protein [Nocardia sp.]
MIAPQRPAGQQFGWNGKHTGVAGGAGAGGGTGSPAAGGAGGIPVIELICC